MSILGIGIGRGDVSGFVSLPRSLSIIGFLGGGGGEFKQLGKLREP